MKKLRKTKADIRNTVESYASSDTYIFCECSCSCPPPSVPGDVQMLEMNKYSAYTVVEV